MTPSPATAGGAGAKHERPILPTLPEASATPAEEALHRARVPGGFRVNLPLWLAVAAQAIEIR